MVVITIPNADTARHVTAIARKMNPKCAIITRTRYMEDSLSLYTLGADEVICEEFETAAEVLMRVLIKYPVPKTDIDRLVASMRTDRYEMLREASEQVPSLRDIELHLDNAAISIVRVEEGAPIAGKPGRDQPAAEVRRDSPRNQEGGGDACRAGWRDDDRGRGSLYPH